LSDYPPHEIRVLLQRIAGGDEKAFGALFYAFVDKLTGYIVHITGSPEVAEEITQEVFLKVWQQRAALQAVENFDNYLFIISRNLTLTHLKKLARQQKLKTAYAEVLPLEERSAETKVDLATLQTLHTRAVESLPPQQRKVYLLSREEGMTRMQIAEALGVGTETVKQHMKLALKAVRLYMTRHLGEGLLLVIAAFFEK
jgi:RNA polymerase sigma-70 factor (family 1)